MPSFNTALKRASKIFYLGIDNSMPFAEVQRTFMFNLLLMIGLPFIIPGIPINLGNGRYHLAVMNFILLVLYSAGIYCNIRRLYLWMRPVLTVVITLVSLSGLVFFRNGTEYNMLINLLSAVLFLDDISFILLSLVIIAAVTYTRVRDIDPRSITSFAEANPYINIFWSQFLYVFSVYGFKYIYFKYQKQLEIAYQKVKQSNETKDRILQVVAHDLRTPVGGISALSQLMLDGTERTEDDKKKYVEMIYQTSTQSLNMINELLQGHTNDVTDLVISRIDVNALLANIKQLMQHKAEEKEQQLVVHSNHAPVVADVDAGKLSRVIHNLVSNAIKFTPTGGSIELAATRNNNWVQVSVKDNGIGIPSAIQSELFSMVSHTKRKGTAGERSFGIGLSVCKQIIDAHKGNILVESKEGGGTLFTVQLPVSVSAV